MIFKNKTLDFNSGHLFIMGILNVTPDSFSDGGIFFDRDKALLQAERMIKEGADIIDIGGESTRPYSDAVSEQEELDRVVPIIEAVADNFHTIISVDTYKSRVAEDSLKAGAEIINDISGFTFDDKMIDVASKYKAKCIVMHIKGAPKDMQIDPVYQDVIKEVYDFLGSRALKLRENGINDIIVDPGFGFGKSLSDNYILLKSLNKFNELGCPVLAGISRKSMIGKVVNIPPPMRLPGTIALDTVAVLNGAKIIRVHDVAEHFQALKVLEKYIGK